MHSTYDHEGIQARARAFADALTAFVVALAELSPTPTLTQAHPDEWAPADAAAKHFGVGVGRIRRAGREHPELTMGRGRARRYRLSAMEAALRSSPTLRPTSSREGEALLLRAGLRAVGGAR